MLKRSPWPLFAFVMMGLIAVGCQPSSDGTVTGLDSEAGKGSSRAERLADGHDNGNSVSMEVVAEAIQPHMAIGSDGRIHLACIHRGNISVLTSQDRGKTFSDPVVAIDVRGRARGGAQRGPRIGVDKNGIITLTAPVTFDDAEYEKKYPTADLFLVRSVDGAKSWSKPQQANEVSKKSPESLHWMTVSADGTAHVAWLDRRDRGNQPGQDIYYATVVDGVVGTNVKIASTVCECCAPGLAADAAGNPFVAFREGGSKPSREIFSRWSTNGGRSFAEARQINKQKTLESG